MGQDLGRERLIGDLLIIAACDQNDFLVEAAQTGDCARRAGPDGVVVVEHAVQRAHRLNAMLYTGEGGADLTHGLDRHAAPDGSDGGQQVLDIVQAAQLDLGPGQNRRHDTVLRIAKGVIALPQEGALVCVMQAGKTRPARPCSPSAYRARSRFQSPARRGMAAPATAEYSAWRQCTPACPYGGPDGWGSHW